jgi:hypothetical protein
MFKVRLRLLAEHLEKIAATPPEKRKRMFGLEMWVYTYSCGTVACACGEATYIKRFQALGFRQHKDFGVQFVSKSKKTRKYGWDAVQSFFGINHDQAVTMFTTSGFRKRGYDYATVADVARTLREFIETETFPKAGEQI